MRPDELDGDFTDQLEYLLKQAQTGDREAQNELFRRFQRYLDFLACQHHNPALGGKLGISDIVQQTMLHAAKEFDQFRGQTVEEFRGWIRRILVNESRDLNRRFSSGKRNAALEIAMGQETSGSRYLNEITDGGVTPSVVVSASEDSQKVLEILEKMPAEMRQVVQLRNWEGLQFNEIAARMGISLSRAAKIWYNALLEFERLHSELNDAKS